MSKYIYNDNGNIANWLKPFERKGGRFPLDKTTVFGSYEEEKTLIKLIVETRK